VTSVIRGAITLLLLFLNIVFWGVPVVAVGLVKLLMPTRETRRRVLLVLAEMVVRWVGVNNRIFDRMLPLRWDIEGIPPLSPEGRYLLVSNHVSWLDILVVFRAFYRRTALIRFFIKQELIWVPIVGQATWVLEFPFMKRYTAEELARHPEKRGQDLLTTYIACRRYRRLPVAILNFLEGTRFTRDKHEEQDSPYRHLLRPRVGGAAFVLASLGDLLDGVVDVTLAYPGHEVTIWEFLCGRVPVVHVRARSLDVPGEFFGKEITEPGPQRDRFKAWIDRLWREKDEAIELLLNASRVREGESPPARPGTAQG
jgi:1-acyl-sn-glycerol-3-phosphate acyltransferase